LAGFAVGIAEKSKALDGRFAVSGDVVLGVPSSGIHSNGYSLVRKLFSRKDYQRWGKILLTPTRIYVKEVLALLSHPRLGPAVKAIAHITGGGFQDNLPRVVPKDLSIRIRPSSWPRPPVFQEIQKRSKLPIDEMFRTFNMGVGLVLVVAKEATRDIQQFIGTSYEIGALEQGKGGVTFE